MTDTTGAAAATPETRPEGLPENFTTVQALADAHREAQQKITQMGQATPPPAAGVSPLAVAPPQAAPGAGLEAVLEKYQQEVASSGTLPEAAYAEFEALGISRVRTQQFFSGQQAEATLARQEVFALTGGEQGYTALAEWMGANLSDSELETYNRIVNAGDLEQIKMAVQGIYGRHQAAVGTEPNLLHGQKVAGIGPKGFGSVAEMTRAMNDPKYREDSAYRKEVEARLARSPNIIGMTGLVPGGGGALRSTLSDQDRS